MAQTVVIRESAGDAPGVSPQADTVRPGNYPSQAKTYDFTRGASPTVIRTLAKHLGPGGDRRLLDVAGGTGNYAQAFDVRGFRVVVVDVEVEMLRRAVPKVGQGRCIVGDAAALPVADRSCDGAIIVNAVHLFPDLPSALREAHRVLRGGRLVFTTFTRENLTPLFVYEYFGLREPPTARPATEEVVALLKQCGFGEVIHEPYVYTDTVDGSLNALHTDPLRLAGPAYLRNTSFWHRLDEDRRRAGLEALARDLRSGVLKERVRDSLRLAVEHGHGTVLAAAP